MELTDRAQAVYQHYLDAVEQIAEGGDADFVALKPYLTADAYNSEIASIKALQAKGIRTVGATKLIRFQAQSVDLTKEHVVAYACVDLSDVKVLDSTGTDVTPKDRPDRQTSLPSFGMKGGDLRLEVNGTWSGNSIC